jgi:hypothetical protein
MWITLIVPSMILPAQASRLPDKPAARPVNAGFYYLIGIGDIFIYRIYSWCINIFNQYMPAGAPVL